MKLKRGEEMEKKEKVTIGRLFRENIEEKKAKTKMIWCPVRARGGGGGVY
jgi:hypothetical protein